MTFSYEEILFKQNIKKHSSAINRLSDKEKDEVIELLYQMNSQSSDNTNKHSVKSKNF